MRHIILFLLSFAILIVPRTGFPSGSELTQEQIKAVHSAYLKAKAKKFSIESMVTIYKLENAASAVKKLVDSAQSNPNMSISQIDSLAMEATRDNMNQMVLNHLAEVTGGTVEVINFGKQNGIRSDKDQTVYAVDGKRVYEASEIKDAYEKNYLEFFGIDMERMDMSLFDGDASIPDWSKADMSFDEFVNQYKKGQAKLEQNPEAYKEAGSYRAQVDGRTANQGKVRITRKNSKTGKLEVINGSAREISERYSDWSEDIPYRNAMDSSVENKGRFDHASDFIDKMKYFNRTIGNGLNALALENWDVKYIFHLDKLKTAGERTEFIRQMVADTYVVDASAGAQQQMVKVINIAANIEIDKMNNATKSEEHYLKPLIELEQTNARSAKKELTQEELLSRARQKFYDMQSHIMDRNIVLTTRQKINHDFDPTHLKKIARKYGVEQAKKLRWETARQISRAFGNIKDQKLIDHLIADTPEHLRPEIEALRSLAEINTKAKRNKTKPDISIRKSNIEAAKTIGPDEVVLATAGESFLEKRRKETEQLINKLKTRYNDFETSLRSGKYSDEAVSLEIRKRLLDSLGFEERAFFDRMESEYKLKFSGSKLLGNVVNMGNVSSLLSCIQVYQQTGDLTKVTQTAVWELVSNIPGVSQAATLKQSFNDGNYESLAWLFISWKMPLAGQIKMVFDVTTNSMKIVYDHAMIPLENDRFSQVYLGYVDKQQAGWSPLLPGWKERREASSLSILQFVPGDTFEEKRSNMYEFFQNKIHAKMVKNNISPTSEEYWPKRDRVLDAFLGTYVQDYFNGDGDFKDNTTSGLYNIAGLPKLKKRLIDTLKRDFEQGEINFRKAEIALDEMNEAIADMEKQNRESIQIQKRLIQSEDFISGKMQQKLHAAFDKVEQEEKNSDKKTVSRIKVDIYPRVVLEGQESRIVVKALSSNDNKGGESHKVEIKPLQPVSIVRGDKNIADKLAQVIDNIDKPMVETLNIKDSSGDSLYVTKLRYEVSVKDKSGLVLSRDEVSVDLAATEQAEQLSDDSTRVMMYVRPPMKIDFSKKGTAQALPGWEKPSRNNSLSKVRIGRDDKQYLPYVWVRWPNMPEDKSYGVRVSVSGGVPYYAKEQYLKITPYKDFEWDSQKGSREKGNAFSFVIPQQQGRRVGTLKVSGELLAFDKNTQPSQMKSSKPISKFPFNTTFTRYDRPYEMTAKAKVDKNGFVTGEIKSKYRQAGKRIARVSSGNSTYYDFFDYKMKFSLPKTNTVPSTISMTFKDYGKDVTIQVPVEVLPARKTKLKDTSSKLAQSLKRIEELKKSNKDDSLVSDIASAYGSCAHYSKESGKLDDYFMYIDKKHEWKNKALAKAKDYNWKDWSNNMPINHVLESKVKKDPSQKQSIYPAIEDEAHHRQFKSHMDAAMVARQYFLIDRAGEQLDKAEKHVSQMKTRKSWTGNSYVSLANKYTSYADTVFHVTGDLNAAKAVYQQGQDIQRMGLELIGKPFKPRPYLKKLDEKFENSHLPN